VRQEHLDRHVTVQRRIKALEDDAHPASASNPAISYEPMRRACEDHRSGQQAKNVGVAGEGEYQPNRRWRSWRLVVGAGRR
jgi:hypothetical protein